MWECYSCKKNISILGKSGPLKLFHSQSLLPKEHDSAPFIRREIIPQKRPLAKADVRKSSC